jgi:hypothetical protein
LKNSHDFCDVDWGNSSTRRSTTGTIFDMTELEAAGDDLAVHGRGAKFYSASEGAVQALCIRGLLVNMGFDPEGWTPIHEDNKACIEWGNNVIEGRERANHIDIRAHFAHEVIQNGHIRLVRVDTANQLADVFTKSLQPAQFAACMSGIRRRQWARKGRRDSRGESRSAWDKSSHANLTKGVSCTQ